MKSIKFEKNNFAIYKSEAGVCLAMCLKSPDFEAGRAYELGAYKKKTVYSLSHLNLMIRLGREKIIRGSFHSKCFVISLKCLYG